MRQSRKATKRKRLCGTEGGGMLKRQPGGEGCGDTVRGKPGGMERGRDKPSDTEWGEV